VHDIRGLANLIPPGPVRDWAETFAEWYATIEPAAGADQDDEDDTYYGDGENGPPCPICADPECTDGHLVASVDCSDGILGGAAFEVWDQIHSQIKDRIFAALVESRRRTGLGSEVDSVLEQLRNSRAEWDVPGDEAGPDEDQATPDSDGCGMPSMTSSAI